MTSKTKTVSKPVTKAAPRAKKATKAAAPMFYASLLTKALAGEFGATIKNYYARAVENHGSCKTRFPRERLADKPLMSHDDALAFIEKHKLTSIPAANPLGQKLFDQMVIESGGMEKLYHA